MSCNEQITTTIYITKGGVPMKNKRAIGILVTLSLILFVFLAGYTFAKYYTVVDGAGSVSVAKWSFAANDNNNNITNISLKDTANKVSLADGSFDIIINAKGSEVDVDYKVNIVSEENIPTNMKFYSQSSDTKYSDLKTLAENELYGSISKENNNEEKIITVYWEWPYDGTDDENQADYNNGIAAKTYQFSIQIEGTQAQKTNS
jgi:hypothetical protein